VGGTAGRTLDNGAVFKSLHGFLEVGQQSCVRIHGDRGLMENLRHGDARTLRVMWDVVDDEDRQRAEEVFLPWPSGFPATTADPLGDGVAETLMLRDFERAVRHGPAPDQDVYVGVELSIVGIQSMRSDLAGSIPVEVPDLRRLVAGKRITVQHQLRRVDPAAPDLDAHDATRPQSAVGHLQRRPPLVRAAAVEGEPQDHSRAPLQATPVGRHTQRAAPVLGGQAMQPWLLPLNLGRPRWPRTQRFTASYALAPSTCAAWAKTFSRRQPTRKPEAEW
jgi:hypothetical protein